MGFKHLSQPDYDRGQDGAIKEVLRGVWEATPLDCC